MLRVLVLLALALQETVAHGPPSCRRHTAAHVHDEFGMLMARLKLRDPGGDFRLNVTIYTEAKLNYSQLITGELDLVDKKRRSPNLIYNVHFPIHNPLPHIGIITFNYRIICQDPVPRFDKYLTTTSYIQDIVRQKFASGSQIRYEDKIESRFSSHAIKLVIIRVPKLFTTGPQPAVQSTPAVVQSTPAVVQSTPWPTKLPARHNPKDRCGQSVVPSKLIYGGMEVSRGDWPWLANVYLEPTMKVFCGSTVISMKHIITAGHCLYRQETKEPYKMEDMVVALGQFNRTNMKEKGVQLRKVKYIAVHGSFDPLKFLLHHDIAVLVLDKPVTYSRYVRNICLWDFDARLDHIHGEEAKVVGWGLTDNMQMTDTPYVAVIPIVSPEECADSHPLFDEVDQDLTLCGGQRTGMGPCMGDSGSGLALQRRHKDQSTRWYLRGVVSFNAPSNATVCNLDAFSLFTDVAKYAQWIKKILRTT